MDHQCAAICIKKRIRPRTQRNIVVGGGIAGIAVAVYHHVRQITGVRTGWIAQTVILPHRVKMAAGGLKIRRAFADLVNVDAMLTGYRRGKT